VDKAEEPVKKIICVNLCKSVVKILKSNWGIMVNGELGNLVHDRDRKRKTVDGR